jgi:hypothetical protein
MCVDRTNYHYAGAFSMRHKPSRRPGHVEHGGICQEMGWPDNGSDQGKIVLFE